MLPLLFLFSSVAAQCLTGNDSPAMMKTGSRKALVDSRFGFALDTLKKTALIETQDNVFYSPHSLHQALTMAYFGARGTTEESLRKALQIPSDLSKVDVQRFYAFEKAVKQQLEEQVRRLETNTVASLPFELASIPR